MTTTAEALQPSPNFTVHTMLFLAVVTSITTIASFGPQILEMATFDSGFGGSSSDDTRFPLPGECEALKARVHDAQGRFNEANSGERTDIAGKRLEELNAIEQEYKQKCKPDFVLTRPKYYPH